MTVAPDRDRAGPSPTARALLIALVLAAAVEGLLLRTATRTFIHIPGLDRFEQPLEIVAELGRAAYYLAVVLLVAVLVVTVREIADRTRHRDVLAAAVLFLLVAIGLRLGLVGDLAGALGVLAAVVLGGVSVWRSPITAGGRAPIMLFVLAFVLTATHTTSQFAVGAGAAVSGTSWLLLVAEVTAVVGAVLTPRLALQPPDRVALGAGTGVTVLTLGALMSGGASPRILMLWNLGLGGALPDVVYAVAAGALAYAIIATVRAGRGVWATALTLLVCGGLGLHSTYQSGLVVAGLVVLTLGARRGVDAGATTSTGARGAYRAGQPA